MARKGNRLSGPMVLVAALGSSVGKRSGGLAGSLAERARSAVGLDGKESDGFPGVMERAGELISAAAVAVAILARLRAESNGGDG